MVDGCGVLPALMVVACGFVGVVARGGSGCCGFAGAVACGGSSIFWVVDRRLWVVIWVVCEFFDGYGGL